MSFEIVQLTCADWQLLASAHRDCNKDLNWLNFQRFITLFQNWKGLKIIVCLKCNSPSWLVKFVKCVALYNTARMYSKTDYVVRISAEAICIKQYFIIDNQCIISRYLVQPSNLDHSWNFDVRRRQMKQCWIQNTCTKVQTTVDVNTCVSDPY